MKIRFLFCYVALGFLLAGCQPFVDQGQPRVDFTDTPLQADQPVGQTFTSRQPGLSSLEVFLAPDQPGSGELILHLRDSAQSEKDLAAGNLPAAAVSQPGFYRFYFQPQASSSSKDYYLLLEIKGEGRLKVGRAAGNSYLDGSLYLNGEPVDAQLAFRPVYGLRLLTIGLLQQALSWLWLLVLAFFVFIVPGWALLTWLWAGWDSLSWGEKFGLAGGVSLACYPLLLLWTNVIGLHLAGFYAWLPPVLGLAAIVWKYARTRRNPEKPISVDLTIKHIRGRFDLADFAFIFVLGLIIFTRFWPVHNLDVPMWGDSYQHTLIAQLIVDNGGLFNSWRPYAELRTFTYHFGFHSAVAVFHWVSGLSLPKSILWTGQLINVLAVLSLYPLAVKIGKSRWAGVIAMIVAGLISSMPMFYINWGRYTQLAGQVILLACIVTAWTYLEQKQQDWRLVGLIWIVWGGLALTHYRVFIMAVLFFIAYAVLEMRRANASSLLVKTFWSAIGVVVLFMPWFVHVFGGKLIQIVTRQLSTPLNNLAGPIEQTNQVGSWLNYLPEGLWLLFAICAVWGLWKRNKAIVLVCLWWFLVFLAGNPQMFHLPGSGVITGFAVMIAAYIPASLIIGGSAGILLQSLELKKIRGDLAGDSSPASSGLKIPNEHLSYTHLSDNKWVSRSAALASIGLILVVCVWGARQRMNDADVATFSLVTRPDLRAFEWIKDNTPADAIFLVNSFLAYNQSSAVGSDAGWWLPLLGQRRSTLPPLTYTSEQGFDADLQSSVKALSAAVSQEGAADPNVLGMLAEKHVTYVYIGQQQGMVNNPGPVLDPTVLGKDGHFSPVYHQDRVWVFKILP